jgi:hypothetical protein
VVPLDQLRTEWKAALADAGLNEATVRLYPFEGEGAGEAGAYWFRPGDKLAVDYQFPDAERVEDANAPENRNLHRVTVWTGREPPILSGRLRHELEHARQWDHHGKALFDLHDLIEDEVLPHKAGGLQGCGGTFINFIPTEQDANAAAAMFLRDRYPEDLLATLREGKWRNLACSLVGPESLESLPKRMICFAYQFRDRCAQVEQERGVPFQQILAWSYDGAAGIWSALEKSRLQPAQISGS